VLEPFLIQQGYITRTARGRMVTAKAYRHFGLSRASEPGGDLFEKEK
jgi:Holliday junction DNA helicase RuvB